ncbi:MAG: hypothetical protein HGA37_05250 [Lentimicrobium sp.]|nr:hypothetical protein [Lentimicrobium sp.]
MRTIIFLLFSLTTITTSIAQDAFKHERLNKLWETQEGLKTTESVLYDPTDKVLYVANINENPWQKDGNGYISKLTPKGKVITEKWAVELSAPKGMGITLGKLYVTNVDEVVEISLKNGTVLQRFTHPAAINLNDIAVSESGNVYVSDSKGDYLFQVINNKLEILTDSPEVKGSNGLYLEKNVLLLGQKNRIAAFNLQTKEITTYIENTGGIDGIEAIGNNIYLISDWMGHVYQVEPGKEKILMLDTSPLKINAADIGFDSAGGILYVPTFFANGVAAYKLD